MSDKPKDTVWGDATHVGGEPEFWDTLHVTNTRNALFGAINHHAPITAAAKHKAVGGFDTGHHWHDPHSGRFAKAGFVSSVVLHALLDDSKRADGKKKLADEFDKRFEETGHDFGKDEHDLTKVIGTRPKESGDEQRAWDTAKGSWDEWRTAKHGDVETEAKDDTGAHAVGVSTDPNSQSLHTVTDKQRPGESDDEYNDRVFREGQEHYHPVRSLEVAASTHRQQHGLTNPQISDWTAIEADMGRARTLGDTFAAAESNPDDPEVQAAYRELVEQTMLQWHLLTDPPENGGMGIRVDFVTPEEIRADYGDVEGQNPYPTADAQARDIEENHHLAIATIASYPTAFHPILSNDRGGEYDTFRAVHDAFGHAAIGADFTRHGEFQAWMHHASMFSGRARTAASTELTGENSFLISHHQAATHKATLLPDEVLKMPWDETGRIDPEALHRPVPRGEAASPAKLNKLLSPASASAERAALFRTFDARAQQNPGWVRPGGSPADMDRMATSALGTRPSDPDEMRAWEAGRSALEDWVSAHPTTRAKVTATDAAAAAYQARLASDATSLPEYDNPTQRARALDDLFARDHLTGSALDTSVVNDELGPNHDEWTPERQRAHREIIDGVLGQIEGSAPRERRIVVMAGLPGAGKSTALRPGGTAEKAGIVVFEPGQDASLPDGVTHIAVNADLMKELLVSKGLEPKVDGLKPMETVGLTHEESSYLAKQLLSVLGNRGYNIALDGTLRATANTQRQIQELAGKGYGNDVVGILAEVTPEESRVSALTRYAREAGSDAGGRLIPPQTWVGIESSEGNSSRVVDNFNKLVADGYFTDTYHVDNRGKFGVAPDQYMTLGGKRVKAKNIYTDNSAPDTGAVTDVGADAGEGGAVVAAIGTDKLTAQPFDYALQGSDPSIVWTDGLSVVVHDGSGFQEWVYDLAMWEPIDLDDVVALISTDM